MTARVAYGLGWRPDLPDPRDFGPNTESLSPLLRGLRPLNRLPERVDWREYFPTVEPAVPSVGSVADGCTQAIRYFERRASGRILDPSRRFAHQTAQRLLGPSGGCGGELRITWKAIARFGIPARRHWPDEAPPAAEPDAFAYAAAERFSALLYLRLVSRNESAETGLKRIRTFLAAGFVVVFGLPVFEPSTEESEIPYPTIFDSVSCGAVALALGYDDTRRLQSGKGTLLVRMPWGAGWGDRGYGWLPYAYVRERFALDFWTLPKPDWLASGEFLQPT